MVVVFGRSRRPSTALEAVLAKYYAIKIWSRSLLRTALKLGGKCSWRRTVHTHKRRPPMGERSGAQLRWFTDFYEENQGSGLKV